MLRLSAIIAFLAIGSAVNAATVRLETKSAATGLTRGGGTLGGVDFVVYDSTVSGSVNVPAQVTSQKSIPGGKTSGFASADIATGEIKAKIQTNPGVSYGDVKIPHDVYAATGVGYSNAEVSETFTASGTGNLAFEIAFDGSWEIAAQTVEGGSVVPSWSIAGNVALTSGSSPSLGNFLLTGGIDSQTFFKTFSLSAKVEPGREYSIFASLSAEIFGGATGVIDFSNTAKLSYSADPGVVLTFADQRFLSEIPTVATVPVPASGFLLFFPIAGLVLSGARANRRRRTRA